MLSAVYSPRNYYLIHVDYKPSTPAGASAATVQLLTRLAAQYDNIVVIPPEMSFRGTWGGISLVWIEVMLYRVALETWSDWGYFLNLSPHTWPIVSQATIEQRMKALNGKSAFWYSDCSDLTERNTVRARC